MVKEKLNNCAEDSFRLLAVIVLYKVEPSQSAAFRTLMEAASALDRPSSFIRILLFDNTPGTHAPEPLPENILYEATGHNMGIAAAYDHALAVAERENCTWLLTLDQDTTLPCDFLTKMSALAQQWQADPSVGAIVPQIRDGARLLSPNYVHRLGITAVPRAFVGFNEGELFAFNSAALLRVAAVRDLGGFCEDFWLDQLDHWLHHRLHRMGKRVFVAGDIQVEHKLSLLDYQNLSPVRFRNFLEAE
jgi:GT2 family glycosyltransferase